MFKSSSPATRKCFEIKAINTLHCLSVLATLCETDVECKHKARLRFISLPDEDDYSYTQRYDNTKPNITQYVKKRIALNV